MRLRHIDQINLSQIAAARQGADHYEITPQELLGQTGLSYVAEAQRAKARAECCPENKVYHPETLPEQRQSRDATFSFFPGHTSAAFAMATTSSYLFSAHHPESSWKLPIWLLTHGLAASTRVMRGLAGKHFWTDVAVGESPGTKPLYLRGFSHGRELLGNHVDL